MKDNIAYQSLTGLGVDNLTRSQAKWVMIQLHNTDTTQLYLIRVGN